MKAHNVLNSIAAAVLVAGLALTGIPSSAIAEQIGNGDRIDGVIRRTSPIYRFRNMWTPGSPVEELRGQEYSFSANEGDDIQVYLDTNRRGFTPVMVLFYGNNKQVAFTQDNSFNYRIPRSGDYKLLVLAKDAARGGDYTLEVAGIQGGERRARDWRDDRGNNGRNSREDNNNRYDGERILRDDLGLRPVDCNQRRSMIRVRFDDGETTYCAIPTRDYPQGDYYYNSRTRDLDSARVNDNRFDAGRDQCRVSVGGVCVTR